MSSPVAGIETFGNPEQPAVIPGMVSVTDPTGLLGTIVAQQLAPVAAQVVATATAQASTVAASAVADVSSRVDQVNSAAQNGIAAVASDLAAHRVDMEKRLGQFADTLLNDPRDWYILAGLGAFVALLFAALFLDWVLTGNQRAADALKPVGAFLAAYVLPKVVQWLQGQLPGKAA